MRRTLYTKNILHTHIQILAQTVVSYIICTNVAITVKCHFGIKSRFGMTYWHSWTLTIF